MEESRSRPGGRSARVRADVLAATLDTLTVVGYASLRLEDVATRAGVHKTTVYRHWPTKAELVTDALLDRSQQRIPVPDTGTLAGDLTALGRSIVGNLRSPAGRRTAKTLVAAAASSPEVAGQAADFWTERIATTRAIVVRAQARGEIAADADPTLVIETLIGPIWVRFLLTGEPLGDDLAADIAKLICAPRAG
jgi:AcrR family transcriptional regulator